MSNNIFLLVYLLILNPVSGFAQDYYRWTDAEGVSHYSQQPPAENPQAEQQTLEITPLTLAIQASPNSIAESVEPETETSDYTGTSAFGKDPELCAQVLQSLQTMNNFENIVMTDPATSHGIYLSESEREAEKILLRKHAGLLLLTI